MFGEQGFAARAEHVGFWWLAGSDLGDSGAEALAGALPKMTSLTALDLSGACLLLC